MKIDIWSDIACPWCYIGKRRFEAALAAFPHRNEVEVTWRSYQLDPSLPAHYDGTEVQYLSERKGIDPQQLAGMLEQVTAQAAGEGLSYDFDSLVVANSFPAHRLIHLARAEGGSEAADAVKEALLSAHFEKGQDIGSTEVLSGIGAAAGVDPDRVRSMLATDEYTDAVNADIAQARSLGVSGVPFFVLDEKYGISGAQPVELFTSALEQAWQESHPLVNLTPASASADGPACGPDGC
ncbi:DsbA family oxidoreductase [Arthrobacter sunyaminii]|uniref:DsbA family oxidoreductase n=1 Tax=Arthrobacter sunyaminii TaxID=2816859 RepID=A0A975XKT4_9MICC|nr:DsbA family oxidoreductase [Arthrobacter sunyaminii]MBO0909716.1 DsbA family oxidoreductase [Arthrobacter sunyaminii]QWQ36515.1 DsbA family oxidoreductase [Arthrobacter sunyaminii]